VRIIFNVLPQAPWCTAYWRVPIPQQRLRVDGTGNQIYWIRLCSSVHNGSLFVSLSTTESYDICEGCRINLSRDFDCWYGFDNGGPRTLAMSIILIRKPSLNSTAALHSTQRAQIVCVVQSDWKQCFYIGRQLFNRISTGHFSDARFLPERRLYLCATQVDYKFCTESDPYVGSKVTWYAEANYTYYIFVFGEKKATLFWILPLARGVVT